MTRKSQIINPTTKQHSAYRFTTQLKGFEIGRVIFKERQQRVALGFKVTHIISWSHLYRILIIAKLKDTAFTYLNYKHNHNVPYNMYRIMKTRLYNFDPLNPTFI